MTHVSPLEVGAFACNSHVTNVTLKTIKNTLVQVLKYPYSYLLTFVVNACTLMQTAIIKC